VRLRALNINTDRTRQHQRKLHIALQHPLAYFALQISTSFSGSRGKFFFRQSRREIVRVQYPKAHFSCLLFDRLLERLICRYCVCEFVHAHLVFRESNCKLTLLILRRPVPIVPVPFRAALYF
jgi:hypothetical protein